MRPRNWIPKVRQFLGATFSSVALLMVGSQVWGQELSSLQAQRPPYYVGEPVVVQIVAKGFDGIAEPACRPAAARVPGISINGPQVNRSVSRFMQMDFGGRTTTRETVNYTFRFILSADAAGEYPIGPFEIEYKGKKHTVEGRTFLFQELEDDRDMELRVSLATTSLYVGQRVPVTVQWAMTGDFRDVQYAFRNLEIRSPLFDQFDLVELPPKTRTSLAIATAGGALSVDAEQTEERRNGLDYVVLTGTAMMVANTVGEFVALPATCRTKRGLSWRRQFFGGDQPGQVIPARASGKVPDFVVKPLPLEGRPPSFAGAVGSGYAIDVSANRTVVRVGDPISLTLAIRGEGLEKMPLPDLSKDGGLDPELFQLPSEPPSGNFAGRMKQFKLNLRVKDQRVNQIPGLAYSWFDPEKEAYVTARSKPIALQVMPAQVLDANDVISARPIDSRQHSTEAGPSPRVDNSTVARGANLAIERDLAKLVRRKEGLLGSPIVSWGAYVVGVGAVLAAVFVRRLADVDPALVERRANIKAWRRQIQQASALTGKHAAQQIADGLRKFLTIAGASSRESLNELIGLCEEAIYAPDAKRSWNDVIRQALQVIDRIEA